MPRPSLLREKRNEPSPRKRFKEDFIQAYFAGFARKSSTTYDTVNARVCERHIPDFKVDGEGSHGSTVHSELPISVLFYGHGRRISSPRSTAVAVAVLRTQGDTII